MKKKGEKNIYKILFFVLLTIIVAYIVYVNFANYSVRLSPACDDILNECSSILINCDQNHNYNCVEFDRCMSRYNLCEGAVEFHKPYWEQVWDAERVPAP